MPKQLTYNITISNVYTGELSDYVVNKGDLNTVVDTINRHYGCEFTSRSGINNFISRGKDKSPQRMGGITITKD